MATMAARPDEWRIIWESRQGPAYDEPAFHYLLDLERRRTAHQGLPLVLMLVELQAPSPLGIAPARTGRLFSVLSACARETDIVGWHRRGQVAGLVLTELGHSDAAQVCALLKLRIEAALDRPRPKVGAYRLHVRIDRKPWPTGRLEAVADTSAGEDPC